jgi:hypothetical protein
MVDHINRKAATVAADTTSARTAYDVEAGACNAVWVHNSGSVALHVKSGDSTVDATTDDNVIPPASSRTLMRDPQDTHLAMRTASSTATAWFHSTSI